MPDEYLLLFHWSDCDQVTIKVKLMDTCIQFVLKLIIL